MFILDTVLVSSNSNCCNCNAAQSKLKEAFSEDLDLSRNNMIDLDLLDFQLLDQKRL